jgi:ABC-type nitrate/sulfonate/bicarbonate transport system permease component
MKNYTIPRTMESSHWSFDADPIEHYPQSRTEVAAGVVLAVVIGIALAVLLMAWWTS